MAVQNPLMQAGLAMRNSRASRVKSVASVALHAVPFAAASSVGQRAVNPLLLASIDGFGHSVKKGGLTASPLRSTSVPTAHRHTELFNPRFVSTSDESVTPPVPAVLIGDTAVPARLLSLQGSANQKLSKHPGHKLPAARLRRSDAASVLPQAQSPRIVHTSACNPLVSAPRSSSALVASHHGAAVAGAMQSQVAVGHNPLLSTAPSDVALSITACGSLPPVTQDVQVFAANPMR